MMLNQPVVALQQLVLRSHLLQLSALIGRVTYNQIMPESPDRPATPHTPQKNRPEPSQTPHRSPGTPRRRKKQSSSTTGLRPCNYTHNDIRKRLQKRLKLTYEPDEWQIELIRRVLCGYDSILLAGTGYGKSLLFQALAVLGGRGKVVLVACPLKALEMDQVCRVYPMSRF